MDFNDPNYPIPIGKLRDHGYPLCRSEAYKAKNAGKLVVTKSGSRNYVRKADADAWLAGLPKVGGNVALVVLEQTEQKLKDLGAAVAAGQIDRELAVSRLANLANECGLRHVA